MSFTSIEPDWFNSLQPEWKHLLDIQYGITSSVDRGKLMEITVLDCKEHPIKNLHPVAEMKNLRQLECVNGSIDDLTPLQSLAHLELVRIGGQVSDLTPLTKLPRLKKVTLIRVGD